MNRAARALTAAATLCAAGVLAVVYTATPVAADEDPPAVTLVTGDRVLFGPAGSRKVKPVVGEGRTGVGFSITSDGEHTYVIPSDALPLVARGQLDRQLFNVTLLRKEGYQDVPVIVQGGPPARTLAGARTVRPLASINGAAMRILKGDSTFWRKMVGNGRLAGGVRKIWLDGKVRLFLDRSVVQIGAPDAWKAGYTGKGVKVAVLDSGVDASHPDLAGRIAAEKNFTTEPGTDLAGHGTHVAATVASTGSTYRGVAPDASLLIGKVVDQNGFGDISALLAAMEWASTEQGAKVVNMSLGGPDLPGVDPVEEAVNRLTAQNGTLFVVAAGNDGQGGEETVSSPSTADAALAVGAIDRDDTLAIFSSRGPRTGDAALKPDVTAPGVGIVAARAKEGRIGGPDDTHVAGTGTSMAAPHVAGAAALLFQQHPDWTPAQVKAALMGSAKPSPGASAYEQGAGRVDLTQAIRQTVLADQPSVSFGMARWPHDDDQPITRTLSYRNTGGTDVTLALDVQGRGPDGRPVSAFRLSANSVMVPAGGTASVDVTTDTRDGPDGGLTGRVTATGDGRTVTTPLAVVRERESYDLTVRPLDRHGKPTAAATNLTGYAAGTRIFQHAVEPDGTVHFRVPRGQYLLAAEMVSGDGARDFLVAPWLDVSAARTLTADARTAQPATVAVDRADASLVYGDVGFAFVPDTGGALSWWADSADLSRLGTAQIGPDAPAGRFVGAQQAVLAVAGADGEFANSPYVYNLAWFTPGKMHSGPRRVRDAELARVRTENLPQGGGTVALKGARASSADVPDATFPGDMLLPVSLPSTREELFTTEGVTWVGKLYQGDPTRFPDSDASQEALLRTYQRGRRYIERWNAAVFGPSLPGRAGQVQWANQIPNGPMAFQVPLFGSAADTAGRSITDTAQTLVYRDGTKVCESGSVTCRIPGRQPTGRYRVQAEATRSLAATSTRINAVWDVNHDGTPALPVQVVRFSPSLDAANSAPGRRAFAVPVAVQRNPGAKPAGLASLTVYVSYDDGAHWHGAPVVGDKVLLSHPAGGYVSLRAKATDRAGNTVDQTIIRAYRLR